MAHLQIIISVISLIGTAILSIGIYFVRSEVKQLRLQTKLDDKDETDKIETRFRPKFLDIYDKLNDHSGRIIKLETVCDHVEGLLDGK